MMIKSRDPSKKILLGKMVILEVGIPVLGSVTTMGIGESQDGGHGALTPLAEDAGPHGVINTQCHKDGQHDPSDFQGSYCCGMRSLMSRR